LTTLGEEVTDQVLPGQVRAHPRQRLLTGQQQDAPIRLDENEWRSSRHSGAISQFLGDDETASIAHGDGKCPTHEVIVPLAL
jgi:hypothetical protein